MECEDYSPYKSALLNSAMININKGGGESSSEDEELYRYGEQNKELLKEQIKEISPDIVICGGTYGIARYAIFDEPKEIRMKCGAYAFRYDGILFVQFVHPAWFSVGRNILYSYFKSVWDEAKNLVIK
ncbi:MAG: hypothetical protein MR991_06290 [Clostridiales bacterium]|nr:hypothetical protein [Clostridiales bacterium]MDD7036064.1 hypothetical protein [Bacillota bacterium]MDY2920850.1 hypothetical protein [Lentihominibacter sp.]